MLKRGGIMKKASLDLSINSIVVLILAVTMLSLGLTFINKTFGGATVQLDKSLAGIGEDRKSQLMQKCQDPACLEFTTMAIKRNSLEKNLLVLNNRLDCDVDLSIDIGEKGTKCQVLGESTGNRCSDIKLVTFSPQNVKAKEKTIVPIEVTPKNAALTTTYRYEVSVKGACSGSNVEKILYLDIEVE
ncbi:MAG: hypothetical protein ABIJ34_07310 [archaeon]